MVSIPKKCQKCQKCQKIYWSIYENSSHVCFSEKNQKHNEKFNVSSKRPAPQPMKNKSTKNIHQYICKCCNKIYMGDLTNNTFCSQECRKLMPTKRANEKWINPPPKKRRKYTLRQLDKMAEWKRVWDDESWTNNFQAYRR